jgi:hypothetical protein
MSVKQINLKRLVPESWHCVDCGMNTAPGIPSRVEMERAYTAQKAAGALSAAEAPTINCHFDDSSEVYTVRDSVWKAAGMEDFGGCLCIGCIEKRLGRELKPKDFRRNHPFNRPDIPGTPRLLSRRDWRPGEWS